MKILMFHDIRDFDPNFFPMRYSQHSFLTLSQFNKGLNKIKKYAYNSHSIFNNKLNYKGYIFTFDDGLKDHLKISEILFKKKISALFFIPFGIFQKNNFVNSHLIQFLYATNKLDFIIDDIKKFLLNNNFTTRQINIFYKSRWKNNLWSKEQIFITRVLREALNTDLRDKLLFNLSKKYISYDLKDLHNNLYLKFEDLKDIEKMGHFICSHGFYSKDLRFENQKSRLKEINKSFKLLKHYKQTNNCISYPNGGFDVSILKSVKKAGYNYGFTTINKDIDNITDPLQIPRIDGTKLKIFNESY